MNSENKPIQIAQTKSSFTLSVPLAIIIAGALIAAAVYLGGSKASNQQATTKQQAGNTPAAAQQPSQPTIGDLRPITTEDHIRGATNAKVTVLEYVDLECPFCKSFHPTLQKLLSEYPNDIRWVYRHSPLTQLHSKAPKEAEATECANELGGTDKFWAYVDRVFAVTPSNDNLDPSELPKIAEYVGLNRTQFESCLLSGKYAKHVEEDTADAQVAGLSGTPYSVIIAANDEKFPFEGAQPYAALKQVVEQALKAK